MTTVGTVAHVVAAGLAGPDAVRAVIVLLPGEAAEGGLPLESWPSHAHRLLRGRNAIDLEAAPAPGTAAAQRWPLRPGPDGPDDAELAALDRLWRRVMAPAGEWGEVLEVLKGGKPQRFRTEALPLPTAEAALAIPLERGRRLLEALAAPESPILARAPTRPGPTQLSALGRPWLGQPAALTRLASLQPGTMSDADRALLLGPPDLDAWIAARDAEDLERRREGDAFFGTPLDPGKLADAALGTDGRDMLAVFDRMHALHHSLVMDGPGARAPFHDAPRRRVTQLMASPALLRLFGLAFDVVADLPTGTADGAWQLSWPGAGASLPCAARLSRAAAPPVFWPATIAEWTGTASEAGAVAEAGGIVLLGRGEQHGLVTLEAALAVCGDYHRQAAGEPDRPPGTDTQAAPISGGLTVIRIKGEPVRRRDAPPVLCSEELRAFYRFDVGLEVEPAGPRDPGTTWRGVMHRTIQWSDPAAPRERVDVEALLAKLMPDGAANPCGLPRHELEAGNCAAVSVHNAQDATFADPRIAIYHGYPGGEALNEVWWDGDRPLWGHRPIDIDAVNGLALNQDVSVPIHGHGHGNGALLPPLRFGWRYRAGIRVVWLGGVARPASDAAESYRRSPDACIPPPKEPGHLYLRHEPLHAPSVFLPPSVPLPRADSPTDDLLQSTAQAVVVTWPGAVPHGRRAVVATARLLLPPPVSLEFASLHEVFDGGVRLMDATLAVKPPSVDGEDRRAKRVAVKVPVDGLRRLAFRGDPAFEFKGNTSAGQPAHVAVLPDGRHDARPAPYYPDPAAGFLAIGLADPVTGRWVVAPKLVRVRADEPGPQAGRWPEIVPVVLEVVAGTAAGRHLVVPDGSPAPAAGLPMPCHTVRVVLGPGEEGTVKAWFVPSLDDLATWFDLCQTAARLAARAGAGTAKDMDATKGGDDAAACLEGLTWLLGEAACGGLARNSGDEGRRAVASLVWARLLEQPMEAIAKVRVIHVLHAVPAPRAMPQPVEGTVPELVRLRDTGRAAVAAFLADALGPRESQDGAVQAVVRGQVLLDLPSTSGLLVEAVVAAPHGPLDSGVPQNDDALVPLIQTENVPANPMGRPDFDALRATVKLLRIEGIPLQPDGTGAPQPVNLDHLQAGISAPGTGLGADGAASTAVQVERGALFADGGARKVRLRITALPRHAAFLEAPAPDRHARPWRLEIEDVWLKATIRPGEPDVKIMSPVFHWDDPPPRRVAGIVSWTRTRTTGLRIELRRPWFKSGEGEQLGILVWPPALPAGATGQLDPMPSDDVLSRLLEDDIGPLGPFVSAWARDPMRDAERTGAPARFPMRREHFAMPGADWSEAVRVPIPGGQLSAGLDNEAVVSVLRATPRYDWSGKVWFVDVGFAEGLQRLMTDRFVRLGLVRFQPNARADVQTGRGDRGIQCSPPASAWSLLPPRRDLRVTLAPGPTPARRSIVTVRLSGSGDAPRSGMLPRTEVTVRLVRTEDDEEWTVGNEQVMPSEADPDTRDRVWQALFVLATTPQDVLGRYAVQVTERDALPAANRTAASADDDAAGRAVFIVEPAASLPDGDVAGRTGPSAAPPAAQTTTTADGAGPVRYFARVELSA